MRKRTESGVETDRLNKSEMRITPGSIPQNTIAYFFYIKFFLHTFDYYLIKRLSRWSHYHWWLDSWHSILKPQNPD